MVEEIISTRFHPKETGQTEAFAFLQKLRPCRGNAFLLRARDKCDFSLRMTKKQKSEKSRKNLTNAEKLRVSEIQ